MSDKKNKKSTSTAKKKTTKKSTPKKAQKKTTTPEVIEEIKLEEVIPEEEVVKEEVIPEESFSNENEEEHEEFESQEVSEEAPIIENQEEALAEVTSEPITHETINVTTYDENVQYRTNLSRSRLLNIIESQEEIPEPVVEEKPVEVKKEKEPLSKETIDKIKKYSIIGAVSVVVIALLIFVYSITLGSNEYKLKKLGYNEKEISIIIEKTTQKNRNYLYKAGYAKIIPDLVQAKGFKKSKFKEYVDYYKKYNKVTVADLIIICNKGADNYKYGTFLMSILTSKDYIQENRDKYMTYHYNNKGASYEDVIYLINNNITKTHTDMLVMIAKEKYFIYDRLDRYVGYYDAHNDYTSKQIVTNVNADLDRTFYTKPVTTDTSKKELMIVNKYYKLSHNFNYLAPLEDVDLKYANKKGVKLNSVAYEAFKKMADDAREKGLNIKINSGYRDYSAQEFLYNESVSSNGIAWTDNWYARAGHSENQTGLAVDIGRDGDYINSQFEYTEEYQWVLNNSYKYGFILRYPKGKEYLTGYNNQPWHYRYVGVEVASKIHELGITYEEYYSYFVIKK